MYKSNHHIAKDQQLFLVNLKYLKYDKYDILYRIRPFY